MGLFLVSAFLLAEGARQIQGQHTMMIMLWLPDRSAGLCCIYRHLLDPLLSYPVITAALKVRKHQKVFAD